MDKPWWLTVIQWTLWVVAMVLVMGWLGRSRFKKRSPEDLKKLYHPVSTLILGLVGFLFFAALIVLSNVFPNETVTWWTNAGFGGFAALSVPVILDYFRARHELTDSGIICGRMFLPRHHLGWENVKRIEYSTSMKWFKIETRSGKVGRISVMLIGLPEFAQAVLSGVPRGAIAPDTLSLLKETASGNPPSVWH